ncbi:MAG: homocysteine S-methyltransferase family protein [Lachnospiraceae bacterium]|nr:homocysteine S-methyltransferase family protein [Lachnospiraceae bacterium]
MTKDEFRKLTEEGILLLDGGTGSVLQEKGLPAGVCPELWISEHPGVVKSLQKSYLESGSRIIYAPTFSANRVKLKEYGLDGSLDLLNSTLVNISKEAVNEYRQEHPESPATYVAGDITMTGRTLKPGGDMELEELIDIYAQQLGALMRSGIDLVVAETMMSLAEARAALIACKEKCPELPVIVTMTFEADGRSIYGTDPLTALVTLQALGADAFGLNCSIGPEAMVQQLDMLIKYARIPLVCKPNAGLPSLDKDGRTVYDMDAVSFGGYFKDVVKAGASIVGGCCGTTPEHIRELKKNIEGVTAPETGTKELYCLSSERKTLCFSHNSPFMVIGERINPTGKKALQAELRRGSFDMVTQFAESQESDGAALLDVNMGMSGVDEEELMLRAIEEVTFVTDLPLSIDTSHVSVMEQALRHYPGRALINSISLESKKCVPLLKLAKKYGAAFILLPLSDEGLPKSLEEKHENIRKLMQMALNEGLSRTDIIVDGLVGTVGANKDAALETIKTVRYCTEELGLATVCGLSNISFGLPERTFINSAFLTLLIGAGLTMAIANPGQEALMNAAASAELLCGRPLSDIRYIEHMSLYTKKHAGDVILQEKREEPADAKRDAAAKAPLVPEKYESLYNSILKGNRKGAPELALKAIREGSEVQDILDKALFPAINRVGELYDEGRYFLPQLIAGGEAMSNAVEALNPYIDTPDSGGDNRPTIVIATVRGDIHDIGKNLVSMMLKNNGFKIVDLGKDVPKEEIIGAAVENKADIVALSALMTTTMLEMKNVINYAAEQGHDFCFMVGGAVITPEYAQEIGARFSSDAADAVRVARELVKGKERQ